MVDHNSHKFGARNYIHLHDYSLCCTYMYGGLKCRQFMLH